jgi:protocatechuate 3,4-dioxygenase beta subunit
LSAALAINPCCSDSPRLRLASAQTGSVKGKITDAEGKPVEGAKVTIQMVDSNNKFEQKTRRTAVHAIGLQPAQYKITAGKTG